MCHVEQLSLVLFRHEAKPTSNQLSVELLAVAKAREWMTSKGKFAHARIQLDLGLFSQCLLCPSHIRLLQDLLVQSVPLHGCHIVLHLHLLSISLRILLSNHKEPSSSLWILRHVTASSKCSHTKLT